LAACNDAQATPSTLPSSSDRVTICVTCVIDISTATAKRISVKSGVELQLDPSGVGDAKLSLSPGPSGSNIDGVIRLQAGSSGIAWISIDHSHELTGDGKIVGEDSDALLEIDDLNAGTESTLVSRITIEGALEIGGDDSFTNVGLVEANDNGGVLSITVGGVLTDFLSSVEGDWKCTNANATLQLSSSIGTIGSGSDTRMKGDWTITDGEFDFDHTFDTRGALDMTGGKVDVSQDVIMGPGNVVFYPIIHPPTGTSATIEVAPSTEITFRYNSP